MSPSASIGSPTTRRALAEAIGTFFLVFIGPGAVMVNAYAGGAVSHAVATDERVADGFAALAVGITVGFCALMGGPLTGASMNPARSFGPALAGNVWDRHWLYWLAPITAMIVAARTYDLLRVASPPAMEPRPPRVGVQGPIPDGRRRN